MTIPFVDFRRQRGPSLGEALLSAGVQGLIADAFRKAAEKRAEGYQIAAEERADVRTRGLQRYGMELSLEQAGRRDVAQAEFEMDEAIRRGELVPTTGLGPEELAEMQSIGAQPVTHRGTEYYAATARTQAMPVDPNVTEALNLLMRSVGLKGQVSAEGTTPEGIFSQANLATTTPLLQSLRELTQSKIAKQAAAGNLLQYLMGTPDLKKYAGMAVREPDGSVRMLLPDEMVGMDKVFDYQELGRFTGDPWYNQRAAHYQDISERLVRTAYADPAEVDKLATQLRSSHSGEPMIDSFVNQAWSIGDEGLLWEMRQGKKPKRIRDRGKATLYLSGNPPLLKALMFQMAYPDANSYMNARSARHPLPDAATLGYLQWIWRLTKAEYELPPDVLVGSVPEAAIYEDMGPGLMRVAPFMVPPDAETGEPEAPVTEPGDTLGAVTPTTSPASGQLEPKPRPGGAASITVVPEVNLNPSELNYNAAYTTAYSAIAADTAQYNQMVAAINQAYSSPEAAMEYYQSAASMGDSERVEKMREMLASGDPEQIAWVKDALEWDKRYTLQMLKQARDDYFQTLKGTGIPRRIP